MRSLHWNVRCDRDFIKLFPRSPRSLGQTDGACARAQVPERVDSWILPTDISCLSARTPGDIDHFKDRASKAKRCLNSWQDFFESSSFQWSPALGSVQPACGLAVDRARVDRLLQSSNAVRASVRAVGTTIMKPLSSTVHDCFQAHFSV